ncbi:hypothetical protein QR680_014531 [Steinernema hermaphroditum]|uniref:Peptidase M13 N-terminal domain-containing protein n=1 Tax=Steinernema hermaphroditum TaxID=289476 RepID=A0AA39I962_9BILA|nr:hypothetical protein QR680_014531 [Steinernema hermaphroditum]
MRLKLLFLLSALSATYAHGRHYNHNFSKYIHPCHDFHAFVCNKMENTEGEDSLLGELNGDFKTKLKDALVIEGDVVMDEFKKIFDAKNKALFLEAAGRNFSQLTMKRGGYKSTCSFVLAEKPEDSPDNRHVDVARRIFEKMIAERAVSLQYDRVLFVLDAKKSIDMLFSYNRTEVEEIYRREQENYEASYNMDSPEGVKMRNDIEKRKEEELQAIADEYLNNTKKVLAEKPHVHTDDNTLVVNFRRDLNLEPYLPIASFIHGFIQDVKRSIEDVDLKDVSASYRYSYHWLLCFDDEFISSVNQNATFEISESTKHNLTTNPVIKDYTSLLLSRHIQKGSFMNYNTPQKILNDTKQFMVESIQNASWIPEERKTAVLARINDMKFVFGVPNHGIKMDYVDKIIEDIQIRYSELKANSTLPVKCDAECMLKHKLEFLESAYNSSGLDVNDDTLHANFYVMNEKTGELENFPFSLVDPETSYYDYGYGNSSNTMRGEMKVETLRLAAKMFSSRIKTQSWAPVGARAHKKNGQVDFDTFTPMEWFFIGAEMSTCDKSEGFTTMYKAIPEFQNTFFCRPFQELFGSDDDVCSIF